MFYYIWGSIDTFQIRLMIMALVLFAKGLYVGRIINWSYEWHSDSFKICLYEYSNINYYVMTPLLPVNPVSGSSD